MKPANVDPELWADCLRDFERISAPRLAEVIRQIVKADKPISKAHNREAALIDIVCEICRTPMRVTRWQFEHKVPRTCSRACGNKLCTQGRVRKPVQACMTCGKPAKPLTRNRCHTCYEYWRTHGTERPIAAG